MKIILNATERKPLAALLGEYTNTKPQYLKAPSYAYQIGDLLLTREGNIEGPDTMSPTEYDKLLALLDASGYCPKETYFHPAQEPKAEATSTEETGLNITIPLDKVNVENLTNLLDAKGSLIKKALGIPATPIEIGEDRISFPWFEGRHLDVDEAKTYTHLIASLCEMARTQKRIAAKDRDTENDKYAFRCFLLRLGFIGAEFKTERKILLRNLSGNSAFKSGDQRKTA